MADNLLTDVLAAAVPQAISTVDAHTATITEEIIDRKIDVSIKNGFDHRITRRVDEGIRDSIAEDGRINRYVDDCIRNSFANNNGSTELLQFKNPTHDRLASLENSYQTLPAKFEINQRQVRRA